MTNLTPDEFQHLTSVSRETIERLRLYAELLNKWQPKINLVGASTLGDLWRRHFLDSAQLFPYLPTSPYRLVDFGSGAGFPGLVLAAMGATDVYLIESDARKGAFLREAARQMGVKITLHSGRMEKILPLEADVATARAVAEMADLLAWSHRHLKSTGFSLFLKSQNVDEELTKTTKMWDMSLERFPSISDAKGCILKVKEIGHVG
jgi:16S rRNA (guanine527-N7)-methyltransferase